MSKINLNFQEEFTDKSFSVKNDNYGYLCSSYDNKVHKEIVPEHYEAFYRQKELCPFCKDKMSLVYNNNIGKGAEEDWQYLLKIWECNCGYFYMHNRSAFYGRRYDGWWNEDHNYIMYADTHTAVKNVEDRTKEKAIKQLINEIQNSHSKLYSIEPKQLEIMVQYVFSAYFQCEVNHIGQSHDGGIDLLIVNSNKPILVQVKRRSKNDAVESVSTIRDFLGAMYIKDNYNGIVVSTAQRFSLESKKVITSLLDQNRLEYFDVFDFNRFVSILNVVNDTDKKIWFKYVKEFEKQKG